MRGINMGTRAVVAKVNNDVTMTGTYVGYDGDPAYALAEIIAIINRDGIEVALDTLITAHSGFLLLTEFVTIL